jgi:uncharacterized protein
VKRFHELRDAVHVFVRMDSPERRVVDSAPVQRLRHIQQLALTSLIYPGATHRRFEHSLGVMELAGRIYDVVTGRDLRPEVKEALQVDLADPGVRNYWRRAVRLAALCHDTGHLPFSHAAEKDLLPEGWHHERLTESWLESPGMAELFGELIPPVKAEHVIKLAVGPRKLTKGWTFSTWEAILSEIIVGDSFGADRMDYLLRDSLHSGVAYGRFDHFRLVDTLSILPSVAGEELGEPALGVEEGGLLSAEALVHARYLMYSQVYLHAVRRIYDIHLKDFLAAWLPGGKFPVSLNEYFALTDNEVTVGIMRAADNSSLPGHDPARRIACRQHFRVLYQRTPHDQSINPQAVRAVFREARAQFGAEHVRMDEYFPKADTHDFPVLMRDDRIASSLQLSEALSRSLLAPIGHVFVSPERVKEARGWLTKNSKDIIRGSQEATA